MDNATLLLLYKNFGAVVLVVPDAEGLELRTSGRRLHAKASGEKMHAKASGERMHFAQGED